MRYFRVYQKPYDEEITGFAVKLREFNLASSLTKGKLLLS